MAACLLFLFLASFAEPGLSEAAAVRPQAIKVYFYHDPGEHIDLSPVTRMITSRAPARAAMNALLAGPTRREEKKGFGSVVGARDFAIGSLTIKEGTARVNFVSTKNWHGWPGDLGPVRFKTAVELTLKQFANVQQVVVSLDGEENFWKEG
jgi:spore germination protein GerM